MATFVEPPRSVRQAVRRAETAIQEKRYAEAIVVLGELSSGQFNDPEFTGQDYVIVDGDPKTTLHRQSLLRQVRDLIGGLPSSGIQLYRLRYDAAAKRDLQAAVAAGDFVAIGDVRRRYFHTDAGYTATAMLATERWLSGHAIETSLLLDDVVTNPRAIELLGDEIKELHLLACATAGRPNGEDRPPTEFQPATTPSSNYPMFGGQPNRNGLDDGQFPLANLRYPIETTASPRQADAIRQTASTLQSNNRVRPPSWVPIRVGDQLLVRTTERLLGIDYQTGLTIWTYPWLSHYEGFDEEVISPDDEDKGESLLTQRVWDDVPYGHVTSDGKRVFMLDNLEKVSPTTSPMLQMRARGMSQRSTSGNTLVALELATEGKLLWRLGRDAEFRDSGEPSENPMDQSFFLAPPLPVDGRLYVLVENAGDINLMCLDPSSGATIWQQTLISVETGDVESDRIRRVSGASLSYHEGVLICPTGAGAVVAMDVIDRTIRWARSYPRNVDAMTFNQFQSRREAQTPAAGRWDASMAVIEGTDVLWTATESDRLYAVNLIDGEPLFWEKIRGKMNYLAGIRDGKFVLVGPRQVVAYDVQSGSSAWSIQRDALEPDEQICGRGVFGKESFFIPTTEDQIIELSMADGSVVDRRKVHYQLGNLICAGGEIISAGTTRLVVAYGDRSLRPLIEARLKTNPDDFAALVRQGELSLLDGKRDEALRYLARARQLKPDDVEVRVLSVQAMLGAMRQQSETSPELIQTLDQLITDPQRRIEFLSLRLQAALRAKRVDESIDRLFELSDRVLQLHPDQTLNPESIQRDSPVKQIVYDAWLSARSEELLDLLMDDDEQRAIALAKIEQRLAGTLSSATSRLLRRRRHFGTLVTISNPPSATTKGSRGLMLELLDRLGRTDSLLAAERLVFGSHPLSPASAKMIDARVIQRLAEMYDLAGFSQDAARILGKGDTKLDRQTVLWPPHARMIHQPQTSDSRTVNQLLKIGRIRHGHGIAMRHLDVAGREVKPMLIRDDNGNFRGVNLGGLPADDVANRVAEVDGGMMISLVGGYIVGCNLYSVDIPGPNLEIDWSLKIVPDGTTAYKRRGGTTPFGDVSVRYTMNALTAAKGLGELSIGPIVGDRFYLLRGGRLAAIDLLTKTILWERNTESTTGDLIANGRHVALVSPMSSTIQYFDACDGRSIAVAPWNGGAIWQTAGPHVFAYQDDRQSSGTSEVLQVSIQSPLDRLQRRGQKWSVDSSPKLAKPILQADVLQSGSVGSTKTGYGRVLDGRTIIMSESTGRTFAWDLLEAKSLFDIQGDADPELSGFNAIDYGDRMALLFRKNTESKNDPGEKLQTGQGSIHRETSMIQMVNKSDGSVLWQKTFDQPWGCTLNQPTESPLIIFSRSFYSYDATNRSRTLDVMALRIEDGRVAAISQRMPLTNQKDHLLTTIQCNPIKLSANADVGLESFRFEFSQTPLPDAESDQAAAGDSSETELGDDDSPTIPIAPPQ